MRYLWLLMVVPVLAFGQTKRVISSGLSTATVNVEKWAASGSTATGIMGTTYSSSGEDTSIIYDVRDWQRAEIGVFSQDSASIIVKISPSVDGSKFGTLVTLDSLITTSNTGDFKGIAVSEANFAGISYLRIYFTRPTWGKQGTTTNKYTANLKVSRFR